MSKISSKIIKEAKLNNEEAFNEIFEEYKYTVFYIAKKYLKNSCDAEECLQDFFMKLWTVIKEYNDKRGNFNTWILTIANNFVIDRYRKLAKEKECTVLNDDLVNTTKDEKEDGHSSYFERIKDILTIEEYEILVYRFVNDLNFTEIALILNTSRETVRRRFNEIMCKAKNYIGGENNE